jgi:hypothetical protein
MTEARDPPDDRAPPAPPELPRRLRLYAVQWIGVPLLVALPLLALLGAFDERRATIEVSSLELQLRIDYPARSRYKEINTFLISVENRAQHALDAVHVVLDPALVDGFTRLEFIPAASSANTIALLGLQPGEAREVQVILQAERSWRRAGEIIATSGAHDTARVHLRTFVLP